MLLHQFGVVHSNHLIRLSRRLVRPLTCVSGGFQGRFIGVPCCLDFRCTPPLDRKAYLLLDTGVGKCGVMSRLRWLLLPHARRPKRSLLWNAPDARGLRTKAPGWSLLPLSNRVERIRQCPELSTATIMMLTSAGHRGDAVRCQELGVVSSGPGTQP